MHLVRSPNKGIKNTNNYYYLLTFNVQMNWIADPIPLNVMSHTTVQSGLLSTYILKDQTLKLDLKFHQNKVSLKLFLDKCLIAKYLVIFCDFTWLLIIIPYVGLNPRGTSWKQQNECESRKTKQESWSSLNHINIQTKQIISHWISKIFCKV